MQNISLVFNGGTERLEVAVHSCRCCALMLTIFRKIVAGALQNSGLFCFRKNSGGY